MNKLLLGTAFIGASLLIGGGAHADTNVYRLYNHNTGEHFYTTSGTEKNANVSAGWTYEGVGWIAPTTSSSPVYRVYNPNAMGGDHYYTKSKYEAQSLVNKGWKWDNNGKAVFYSGVSQAVYVAYNPNAQSGAHNYTESSFEQNSLLNTGWKYGAVAWYGIGVKNEMLNIAQIVSGNFSSIVGTWKDTSGNMLEINAMGNLTLIWKGAKNQTFELGAGQQFNGTADIALKNGEISPGSPLNIFVVPTEVAFPNNKKVDDSTGQQRIFVNYSGTSPQMANSMAAVAFFRVIP